MRSLKLGPILPRRTSVWPAPSDLDLLRAALLDSDLARQAWDRWRLATGGFPDAAQRRLLPLVEWNLRRSSGVDAVPEEPGFVELAPIQAEALAEAGRSALAALANAGLKPLVIKGFALAHLYYPHPALRRMADIDLLVRPKELERAGEALETVGWKLDEPEPQSRLLHLHGIAYRRADSPEIDLHFRALEESAAPDVDQGFISRAIPASIGGVTTWTLTPPDHLFCVCIHGLRWNAVAPIHWVADAAMILRRSFGPREWEIMLDEARCRRLALPLERALRLVRTEIGGPVPGEILDALSRMRSEKWRERWEVAARMRPPSLLRGIFLHWCGLAREEGGLSMFRRLWRFPGHLRELWALDHIWQVPVAAIQKSFMRMATRRK